MKGAKKIHDCSEAEAVSFLRKRLADQGYIVTDQVSNVAGDRRADALAIQIWHSRGIHIDGFEFKRSRADVAKELADPSKADTFAKYCHHWTLLTPSGLVDPDELPPSWGLWEIQTTGKTFRLRKTKKPLKHPSALPVPPELWARILSRVVNVASQRDVEGRRASYNEGYDRGLATRQRDPARENEEYNTLQSQVKEFERSTGLRIFGGAGDSRLKATLAQMHAQSFDAGWWLDNVGARISAQSEAFQELKQTFADCAKASGGAS